MQQPLATKSMQLYFRNYMKYFYRLLSYSNYDIAIMCRDIETKFLVAYNSRVSDSEQISEHKHELLKEKEKSSQLEADIPILVQGRNREINELKNSITCLENKLKSSVRQMNP